MNKDKLKEIVKLISEIVNELNLEVPDKDTLDFAIRIYNSESINVSKEFHKPFTTFKESDKSDKPSQKQIDILIKNKIKIPADMTKKEASILIKELFSNLDKKKYGVEY